MNLKEFLREIFRFDSLENLIDDSVRRFVYRSIDNPVWNSVWDSVGNMVEFDES